jgi:DNA-binding NtrC family response regulator
MSPTVLIVDDDEALRTLMSDTLADNGFDVVSVTGSFEALTLFDAVPFQGLVADVCLAEGEPHGVSLARMVRTHQPQLPIVIVTGHPQLIEAEEPVPGLVLIKPFDPSEVVFALRAQIQQGAGKGQAP